MAQEFGQPGHIVDVRPAAGHGLDVWGRDQQHLEGAFQDVAQNGRKKKRQAKSLRHFLSLLRKRSPHGHGSTIKDNGCPIDIRCIIAG